MRAVPIAELKDHLSAYLRMVQNGQEVVIRDRNKPIAKIVRLPVDDLDEEEQELVRAGLLTVPSKPIDIDAFLAIGKGVRGKTPSKADVDKALEWVREDIDVSSILGHKRGAPPMRSRATKRKRQ